jgi:hypothetical protein
MEGGRTPALGTRRRTGEMMWRGNASHERTRAKLQALTEIKDDFLQTHTHTHTHATIQSTSPWGRVGRRGVYLTVV